MKIIARPVTVSAPRPVTDLRLCDGPGPKHLCSPNGDGSGAVSIVRHDTGMTFPVSYCSEHGLPPWVAALPVSE